MSSSTTSVLELTGLEKSCCVHASWITICHAAHLTGDHTIIVKNIQHVIPHLLKRYSRMRTRLRIDGYQHLLEFLDYDDKQLDIDLFYSIINTNEESWEKIAENECNRSPYSDNGKTIFPLYRFILICNENISSSTENIFHLLLFSHHFASDGRSGYILLNDFLTLVTSSDLHERKESINTQIIPCTAQLMSRPYGLLFGLMSWISKRIYQRELRKLHHPRIPVKAIRLNDDLTSFPYQPVKNYFLFSSSSSTLYSRLHEKCRSQQVTMNGPLLACLLLAVHHCFPSKKEKKNRYLSSMAVDLAVDLRSRLPQSPLTPQTVGFSISICEVKLKGKFPLNSTSFWTFAKKCMRTTNKELTNGNMSFLTHFYNNIMNDERKFNELARCYPNGLSSELALSNIGKYPFSCDYNQGQLKLHGIHVINNSSVYYSTAMFYITCVGDSQLDFSLAHVMESEEKALEFLNSYIHLIEACADADIGITLDQLFAQLHS